MQESIKIELLKYPNLKKCECCERVRDIYYKLAILDYEESDYILGNLNLCKQCGDNFNKILGNKDKLGEKVLKEFTF